MTVLSDSESRQAFKLHIVFLSDSHGRYISELGSGGENETVGLDRLVTYINKVRCRNENVLIIDNGDSIQGNPLVDLHDYTTPKCEDLKHPLSILHRELQTDCFVVGNHEFDFGLAHLDRIRQESDIPWLGANVFKTSSKTHYFDPYRIFNFEGIKVGVLGLVTELVPMWESKSNLRDLEFRNVVETAERLVPDLASECDLLIVAYHGGLEKDPETGEKWSFGSAVENQGWALCEKFPQIDLLLTGHQHRSLLCLPYGSRKTTIVQPFCHAKGWAHILVEQRSSGEFSLASKFVHSSDYPPERKFRELLSPHVKVVENVLRTPLGTADESFSIKDPMQEVWLRKHPLIQWINNLMCQTTGFDIAACPLLDADLTGLPARVSIKDILENFFFQDSLCVLSIDGKILKSALEKTAGFFHLSEDGARGKKIEVHPDWKRNRILSYYYDIWDGIEYGFDIGQPVGKRLAWLKYHGKDVLDNDELQAAVISFRAFGSFYDMFSQEQIIQEFPAKITDLMTNDLFKNETLKVKPIQNFTIFY
ncbi:MAG: bifunctional metallophosphatase/5'-nucleotidase [Proteobacteria bacterium]|nr:bifunctional metallophosphatase/5'-nucleotidase [Pseudomonadota bacterium]